MDENKDWMCKATECKWCESSLHMSAVEKKEETLGREGGSHNWKGGGDGEQGTQGLWGDGDTVPPKGRPVRREAGSGQQGCRLGVSSQV